MTDDDVMSPSSGRKRAGVHRAAVTRMLRATGLAHAPEEAPLVELVKSLAVEMDEAPSASTSSRYRAALADVRRVLDRAARPASPPAAGPLPQPDAAGEKSAPVSSLQAFKDARGIGAG
ncbi:hypothetical protein [Microbacterium sp. NPDC089188]|uniref:hypothetical protein n=1 Tax=Microbacterium sp. NPDC089188 TaxID=3154971 RepID=UPI0034252296